MAPEELQQPCETQLFGGPSPDRRFAQPIRQPPEIAEKSKRSSSIRSETATGIGRQQQLERSEHRPHADEVDQNRGKVHGPREHQDADREEDDGHEHRERQFEQRRGSGPSFGFTGHVEGERGRESAEGGLGRRRSGEFVVEPLEQQRRKRECRKGQFACERVLATCMFGKVTSDRLLCSSGMEMFVNHIDSSPARLILCFFMVLLQKHQFCDFPAFGLSYKVFETRKLDKCSQPTCCQFLVFLCPKLRKQGSY